MDIYVYRFRIKRWQSWIAGGGVMGKRAGGVKTDLARRRCLQVRRDVRLDHAALQRTASRYEHSAAAASRNYWIIVMVYFLTVLLLLVLLKLDVVVVVDDDAAAAPPIVIGVRGRFGKGRCAAHNCVCWN